MDLLYLGAFLEQLADLSLWFMFAIILTELTFLWVGKKVKMKKESWVSLLCYGLGYLPYILFFTALQFNIMMWLYEHARIFTLGTHWYVWVLAFIAFDFIWWVVHFAAHKVRFLWCIHGVHHTPKEMNMSVAIRGSLFDFIQYIPMVAWLPVLGFHPYLIFVVEIISRFYGIFTHLNEERFKRTPLFDRVMITPSLHRIHHASNHLYIDTNFSNLLSVWDRIFKTYQRQEDTVKPVFGLMDKDLNTESVISSQFGLWQDLISDIRAAPRFADKVKYVFMPPGWSPDNGGKTANNYRNDALKELNTGNKTDAQELAEMR